MSTMIVSFVHPTYPVAGMPVPLYPWQRRVLARWCDEEFEAEVLAVEAAADGAGS